MEQMGVRTDLLARIAGIDRTHLGRILQHSARCSLDAAFRLSTITNVPVENLVQWDRNAKDAQSNQPEKTEVA